MNAPVNNLRQPGHPIDDQFRARWSPRAFADDTMTEAQVLTLLEAARWAPSASNLQPWRFVYGLRGDKSFAAIAEALVPFNRMWAEKAAALIVVASKTTTPKDGVEVPNGLHAFDTGTAWGHLALQAHLAGWISHGMAGFDHAIAARNLHLPDGYAIHAVVAVGRQGDPASLPATLQTREHPNDRVALSDIARHGSFA